MMWPEQDCLHPQLYTQLLYMATASDRLGLSSLGRGHQGDPDGLVRESLSPIWLKLYRVAVAHRLCARCSCDKAVDEQGPTLYAETSETRTARLNWL